MTTQQKLINMLCVAILKKKHRVDQGPFDPLSP